MELNKRLYGKNKAEFKETINQMATNEPFRFFSFVLQYGCPLALALLLILIVQPLFLFYALYYHLGSPVINYLAAAFLIYYLSTIVYGLTKSTLSPSTSPTFNTPTPHILKRVIYAIPEMYLWYLFIVVVTTPIG